MEILAINLPQFHRIKENDEWWGEGFTEWTNVKKAKPIYKKHIQPLIPIDRYYYDLSNIKDIKRQCELANEYGVDGFIYYHYWFNGKLLLEKPCELLRENKDIKTKYAFCWANEPWTKAWDGKEKNVILEQNYGNKEDWLKHIEYLYSFFKDERYIKVDGMPMLYIYSASKFPNFDEMIECWNEYLKSKGLKEIYLVEYISTKNKNVASMYTKSVMEFEPLYTTYFDISIFNFIKRFICKKLKKTDYQNYDKLWKYIINRKRTYKGLPIIRGAFSAFDNSPRKGTNSLIIKGSTSKKFGNYLEQLINNNRKDADDRFVVINAWNEWGEGAILEPTEQFKYTYLEEIKRIKNNIDN